MLKIDGISSNDEKHANSALPAEATKGKRIYSFCFRLVSVFQ